MSQNGMSAASSFTSGSVRRSIRIGTNSKCLKRGFATWLHLSFTGYPAFGHGGRQGARPSSQAGSLTSVQPFHVISYPLFERKQRRITKRAANLVQIRLREILIMGVGIINVIGR